MEENKTVTSIHRKPSGKRVRQRKNQSGSQPTKTKTFSIKRPGLDFLKTVFHPYPKEHLHPVFNQDNYDYLYRSAKNYSNLLGSSFTLEPDPKGKDFVGLYNYFRDLLPKDQLLEVYITDEKKLLFDVYFNPDYIMDGYLHYIPLEIINYTEGEFNTIVLSFFQLFQQSQGLGGIDDYTDFSTIIYDRPDCDEGIEEKELALYLREFEEGGFIYKIFESVHKPSMYSYKELRKKIDRYQVREEQERLLLECMKKGLEILEPQKRIFDYAENPELLYEGYGYACETEEEMYENVVKADDAIRYVYTSFDYVTRELTELFTIDSGEYGTQYFRSNYIQLTPDTKEILQIGFVDEFFIWLENFKTILKNYRYYV